MKTKKRLNKAPFHRNQIPDESRRFSLKESSFFITLCRLPKGGGMEITMIQKIWICLLIPIVFAVSGCGENTVENHSVQADSSIADSGLRDDDYPETDDSYSQTEGAMDIADSADAEGAMDTADSADVKDATEISENISMEKDFPIKYETGGRDYCVSLHHFEEDRVRGSKGYSVDEVAAMMRSAIREAAGHGTAE
ncbi:MAG: hypothetical protein LIO75_05540 [Lachnospiraceae bacterium]|nr:hypothetical protein [Lachnospiraceae bacterium]